MLFGQPVLHERELSVIARIEELRKQLRFQTFEPRRWMGSLRRLSLARAVQASNSIEGFRASLEDVAAAMAGDEPLDADHATTLALRGYQEAMTYVLQLAGEADFEYSTQLLKSLHYMMTNYDLANRPGLYRAGTIYVRNEGSGEVVYEGPDIELIPGLMHELESSLNETGEAPALVRAAMAHLNLAMIHPFLDGNGRMARCLQTLVLAREGILAPQFCSVEEYLGRNTEDYYDVLAEVGGGRWHPEHDARVWLRFMLTAHLLQARTLLRRVQESGRLWSELETLAERLGVPERTIPAMFDASLGMRVRNATYRSVTEEAISDQMASRDLRLLVDRGILEPHGERRGRIYTGTETITSLWKSIREKRGGQDLSDPFRTS